MEASAPIVRPLYRSLLIAAQNLAKQIERHGGVWSQILPQVGVCPTAYNHTFCP